MLQESFHLGRKMLNSEEVNAAQDWDLIIVGGGLSGTVVAYFLAQDLPHLRVLLVDDGTARGQSHTWSCHKGDLSAAAYLKLKPFLSKEWPSYQVSFPGQTRTLDLPYCSMRSEDWWQRLDQKNCLNVISDRVTTITPNQAMCSSGRSFRGQTIFDARGFQAGSHGYRSGWQKFLGLTVAMDKPHHVTMPTIMDATIAQHDGFRFFYVLPFSDHELLIEDTYYSNNSQLDCANLRREIADYCATRWNSPFTISGEEKGILPIPLDLPGGDSATDLLAIGMRGGFFHPTTGYSLPYAVQVAEKLTSALQGLPRERLGNAIAGVMDESCTQLRQDQSFYIRLNRMLFQAGSPQLRYKILAQFYRRSPRLIAAFYSGHLRSWQKAQMLFGRPPVPLRAGLKHFFSHPLNSLPNTARNAYEQK